jgi:F-type H+-transporting ATPase subunit epsilon
VAHTPFQVEVLTPDGSVFADAVEMLSTRTTVGEIGILANHAPLLAMLEPTELRLHVGEGDVLRFAQSEGYLQVGGNRAMLLVTEVHRPEELDAAALRERLAELEHELAAAEQDSERQRSALREQRRTQAFLRVAERAPATR